MAFIKRQENFVCEHCHAETKGDGYTNHCPKCLWSKHVDVDPGDRQHSCQGLMEPVHAEPTRDGYRLTHRCVTCGQMRDNRSSPSDNTEILISLTARDLDRIN